MKTTAHPDFTAWRDALEHVNGRARILARIRCLAEGNPGDHRTLTGGISELRVDVGGYYTQRGNELVILLVSGDKGPQQQDIETAKKLARLL